MDPLENEEHLHSLLGGSAGVPRGAVGGDRGRAAEQLGEEGQGARELQPRGTLSSVALPRLPTALWSNAPPQPLLLVTRVFSLFLRLPTS